MNNSISKNIYQILTDFLKSDENRNGCAPIF